MHRPRNTRIHTGRGRAGGILTGELHYGFDGGELHSNNVSNRKITVFTGPLQAVLFPENNEWPQLSTQATGYKAQPGTADIRGGTASKREKLANIWKLLDRS